MAFDGRVETDLGEIAARVQNGTLSGADQIGLAVGPAAKRYRMRKHFKITTTRGNFGLGLRGLDEALIAVLGL